MHLSCTESHFAWLSKMLSIPHTTRVLPLQVHPLGLDLDCFMSRPTSQYHLLQVALDELGRGSSSHDGEAIAHAALTHLTTRVQPLLLFATHYHHLDAPSPPPAHTPPRPNKANAACLQAGTEARPACVAAPLA